MSKQLKGTWSFSAPVDLSDDFGMATEKEISDVLAKEITKEIDQEIMMSILLEQGWTEVIIQPGSDFDINQTWIDIEMWCDKNLKSKYSGWGKSWVFESKEDATFFALKWA